MWTKGQGAQAADVAIASYRSQLAELESELSSVSSDRLVVLDELQDALAQAVAVALPDASHATLARAGDALGLTWLTARRHELESKRAEWQARLAQIERDPYFVRRQTLLHASRGELVVERQQLQAEVLELERRLALFDTETFRWLSARQAEQALDRGALGSFWDAVTFTGYRIEKAKARCAKELGFETYLAVVEEHHRLEVQLRQVRHRLQQNESLRQRVLSMLEEHANLYAWTTEFEPRLCEMLRADVVTALKQADLRAVHGAAPAPLKPPLARADALAKKADYLGNLHGFLQNQAADRKDRIAAIQRTRVAWAMKPWERIPGNKSKWLVGLPAAKKESTHKQVRFARRMHHNIIEFEDYDDYSYYLDCDVAFLAYDAFAWGAEEPMPYEGFSRAVLPELATFRVEHQQERADFGFFRSADKQAAAEERAAATHASEAHEVGTGEDASGGAAPWSDATSDAGDAGEPGDAVYSVEAEDAGDEGGGGGEDADDLSEAEAGLEVEDSGGDAEDAS